MKVTLFIIFVLSISTWLFAKDISIKSFNESLLDNIDQTISDNPEIYEKETVDMRRAPASVPSNQEPILEDDTSDQDGVKW